MKCTQCGRDLTGVTEVVCPDCGTRRPDLGIPQRGRGNRDDPRGTVMQPRALFSQLSGGDAAAAATADAGSGSGRSTELLSDPITGESPPLQLEADAYFLVLGAKPGEERAPLAAARTVFGREQADVRIPDGAASSRHFQVDVMGSEFFIRDLGSTNGTYLNGSRVRFTELRPGDEVRVGRTVLVFRVAGDGLSR